MEPEKCGCLTILLQDMATLMASMLNLRSNGIHRQNLLRDMSAYQVATVFMKSRRATSMPLGWSTHLVSRKLRLVKKSAIRYPMYTRGRLQLLSIE